MAKLNEVMVMVAAVGLLASGSAQPALYDRGGGLIFDDVLNITWLQDANYAKTSGYDADGQMSWDMANTWATTLNIHDSVRNVDLTGWRLAANKPVGADWNYGSSYDGSTDLGLNITSPHSELSYMYYVNLGLKGIFSPAGGYQPDWGIFGNGAYGGQQDVGPVRSLQSANYWSGTSSVSGGNNNTWFFSSSDGRQGYTNNAQYYELYAWAVRPGDVAAPVPEPEIYTTLLTGLGLMGAIARRRKIKQA